MCDGPERTGLNALVSYVQAGAMVVMLTGNTDNLGAQAFREYESELDEDLTSVKGMRLLPKGQEITSSILLRVQGLAESIGVSEPFRVIVAR